MGVSLAIIFCCGVWVVGLPETVLQVLAFRTHSQADINKHGLVQLAPKSVYSPF